MRSLNSLLKAPPLPRQALLGAIFALAAFVAGCASERPPRISPTDAHALIERALPNGVGDRSGWTDDIYTGFTAQGLEPTQVNVAFLKQTSALRTYPYPVKSTMADELFTRRGSVYFGIAHLLGYEAPYPRYLFRFADYNAGQYASRNAAFQGAVSTIS